MDTIVGIDLGTTNSEIAALVDGQVRVIGAAGTEMLASCVGLSPSGELLVGAAARNQALLYPERTIRSIKRRMGTPDPVALGNRRFTPPEVSALILRQLVAWAQPVLGARPGRAVITVPAYFSDAQRQATREAGALAGLEVVRILNEPTAASLAYGVGAEARTSLVFDLGGGTFDVSVVRQERDVTEVLASHGNNHLGGDDFTDLLVGHLAETFARSSGVDVRQGHPAALARLWWAAEAAKQRLSAEPYARVVEESLVVRGGVAHHLDLEVSRADYEGLIHDLVESTVASVRRAMADAGTLPTALDDVLLVGGSSRTPLVQQRLRELTGRAPRAEVNPDLCVALGAGVMASRLAGHDVDRVLVDISPYAFGISHLGERDGQPYPYCFRPTIPRNSALPVTRTESYFTVLPYQEAVRFEIFQGDDPDALRNVPVGAFTITDLATQEEQNEVLCRMRLDLDGILTVTALEKRTGLSKAVTIEQALRPRSEAEIDAARAKLDRLFAPIELDDELDDDDGEDDDAPEAAVEDPAPPPPEPVADEASTTREARALLERSRGLLDQMHPDDQEEAIGLHQAIEQALAAGDAAALDAAVKTLNELVFFVAGR